MPSRPFSSTPITNNSTAEGLAYTQGYSEGHPIEQLVSQYHSYIHRLAVSILNERAEADDATQEAFIAAMRALPGFRGQAEVKTWLTRIAVNVCRARLRKRKLRQKLQSALQGLHLLAEADPEPEATAIRREADRQLWEAVDSLDEKHRLVVVLRYVHELSIAEIAAVLGTREGTVHSRLFYARSRLMARLGNDHPLAEVPDGSS